jgi:transcriptional regulator with XRE-family HTH domain
MFYEKLKKLCFERGISVSKMAVDLKISTTTVTGWKRGSTPQSAQVKKIAGYFKISTDELMEKTPPPDPTVSDKQANANGYLKEPYRELLATLKGQNLELLATTRSQQIVIQKLVESNNELAAANNKLIDRHLK